MPCEFATRRSIVSNGVHTDAIHEGFAAGHSFAESLADWLHEPDPPNYTPRIAGYVDLEADEAWLAILKASPFDPERSERHFFRFDCVEPGYGYAITTYDSDGDPLPCVFWSSLPFAPCRCVLLVSGRR